MKAWIVGVSVAATLLVVGSVAYGGEGKTLLPEPVHTTEDAWFSCVVNRASQDFRTTEEVYFACVFPDGYSIEDAPTVDFTDSGPRAVERCSAVDGGGTCVASTFAILEWNDWAYIEGTPGVSSHLRGSATWTGFDPSGAQDFFKPLALAWRPKSSGVCSGETAYDPLTSSTGGDLVWLSLWDGATASCLPGHINWAQYGASMWPNEYFASSGDPDFVGNPTIEVEGVFDVDRELRISLASAWHDGEDVTCTIQGSLVESYEGTITSGEFLLDAIYVFEFNGVYGIECLADDGVFDGTDPEIGAVRRLITIGTGLGDVVDNGCGSWTNIACHIGQVLYWAFVPEDDVIAGFVDTASEAFPFAVFAEFFEISDALLTAFEADPVTPGIEFEVFFNDPEGETVGFYLPTLSELQEPGTCALCETLVFDGETYGTWNIVNAGDGGIGELWGFRTTVRNLAMVILYVGWIWAIWRWADRKMEASS